MYKELCAAFPEIEQKKRVTLEMLQKYRLSVETDKNDLTHIWPERMIAMQYTITDGADKTTWRLTDSIPDKDAQGNYRFNKKLVGLTTANSNVKTFVTDPYNPNNDLELLFMLYHFCPSIENSKVGNKQKALWRFVNKEKDAELLYEAERAVTLAKAKVYEADLNVLISLYEAIYNKQAPDGITRSSLSNQFTVQIAKDNSLAAKVNSFFAGLKGGVSQDVIDLVKLAVEKGVLVTGADGSGVFLKTTNKTDEILADKTTEDVEIIAEFVSKNNSLKGNLRKLVK